MFNNVSDICLANLYKLLTITHNMCFLYYGKLQPDSIEALRERHLTQAILFQGHMRFFLKQTSFKYELDSL